MKFLSFYRRIQYFAIGFCAYLFLYSRFWWWITYYHYFPYPRIYATYDNVTGGVTNADEANFYSDTDWVPLYGIIMRRIWVDRPLIACILSLILLILLLIVSVVYARKLTLKDKLVFWGIFLVSIFILRFSLDLELSDTFT